MLQNIEEENKTVLMIPRILSKPHPEYTEILNQPNCK